MAFTCTYWWLDKMCFSSSVSGDRKSTLSISIPVLVKIFWLWSEQFPEFLAVTMYSAQGNTVTPATVILLTSVHKSLARCDKTQQFGVSAKSDNCIECSYRKYWCTDGKIYINGRRCTAEEIYIEVLSVDYSSDDTNSNEAINPSSIMPNFLRTVLRDTCDVNVLQQTADDRRKKFHWIRDQR